MPLPSPQQSFDMLTDAEIIELVKTAGLKHRLRRSYEEIWERSVSEIEAELRAYIRLTLLHDETPVRDALETFLVLGRLTFDETDIETIDFDVDD